MSSLTEKLYKTPTHSITYDYLFQPASDSKPTLVFLHGFPDSRHCWRKQLPYFAELGYGIVAPNLLGYGKTDKPLDPQAFRYKRQVESILELLDHEKVEKFVIIGHDWGSVPTGRIVNYAPERILGAVFIAVPYLPPKQKMDVAAANAMALNIAGYERHGYFYFLTQPDGADIIKAHVDSFITLAWNEDPDVWKTNFCPTGAMQKSLESDYKGKTAAWFTEEDREYYKKSILEGIDSQRTWYKVSVENLSYQEDIDNIPEENEIIKPPVLLMPCLHDAAVGLEMTKYSATLCKDVVVKELDSSHWAPPEIPDIVNANLKEFFETRLKGV